MDVEEPDGAWPWDREPVTDAGRRGEERAWAGAERLVTDGELELALEDVERIGVVVVDVRLDRSEPGLAPELEDLGLVALVPDAELAPRTIELLALAGA